MQSLRCYRRAIRAVQLHCRTGFAVSSFVLAVVVALAAMTSPGLAQIDTCKKLDNELVEQGKGSLTAEEKQALATPGPATAAALQKAGQATITALARNSSTLLGNLSKWLSGPGDASISFQENRIGELKDASKVCIRAFALREGAATWEPVRINQVYLTEKSGDKPARLNASFEVDKPSKAWTHVQYLFVGALSDTTPPVIAFSHSDSVSVISNACAVIAALAFIAVFYLILAWATYTEETQSLEGPAWFAYTFSPIRISAAWFGEASMSQVQLLVFTLIVSGLLFYHWLAAGVLSDISANLLMLIGISAVGTGASKFAQTVKTRLNDKTARYLIGKGWYGWELIPPRSHATLHKLLLTDGRLDIYKFQMAIFTVVVACYVVSAGYANLVDVKISDTMLYLIGISQGVYVGGKAVTDRTTDLEASVQKMIELEDKMALLRVAGAVPDDVKAQYDLLLKEYAKAAESAVVEFTSLQNRKFPTKFDLFLAADTKMKEMRPRVTTLREKIAAGTPLTTDEQALDDEFTRTEMTAKELAAYKKPASDHALQEIENIDPAVLRP